MTDPRTLHRFPETLAVVRLGPGSEVPGWAESSSVFSVVATATETSVVCAARSVPGKAPAHRGYVGFVVQAEEPTTAAPARPRSAAWLAGLLGALAEEDLTVFVLSTHTTDWLLVPADDADRAAEAWRRQGHTVAPAPVVQPPA